MPAIHHTSHWISSLGFAGHVQPDRIGFVWHGWPSAPREAVDPAMKLALFGTGGARRLVGRAVPAVDPAAELALFGATAFEELALFDTTGSGLTVDTPRQLGLLGAMGPRPLREGGCGHHPRGARFGFVFQPDPIFRPRNGEIGFVWRGRQRCRVARRGVPSVHGGGIGFVWRAHPDGDPTGSRRPAGVVPERSPTLPSKRTRCRSMTHRYLFLASHHRSLMLVVYILYHMRPVASSKKPEFHASRFTNLASRGHFFPCPRARFSR